jgi:UPF0271 protein
MRTVDLNCDLGEANDDAGQQLEDQLLRRVSSVNVACGGHAGSRQRLLQIAAACGQHGTAFGAHPAFPDRAGFGRREIQMPPAMLLESLRQQLQLAAACAGDAGLPLSHVKPHGALYNIACSNLEKATVLLDAIRLETPTAILFALAGSPLADFARQQGIAVAEELFADRGYAPDGTLLPRQQPGAVITQSDAVSSQVLRAVQHGRLRTVCGNDLVQVAVDTICVHSDTPHALEIVERLREVFEGHSIQIQPPHQDDASMVTRGPNAVVQDIFPPYSRQKTS